jgi:hypothetical protein
MPSDIVARERRRLVDDELVLTGAEGGGHGTLTRPVDGVREVRGGGVGGDPLAPRGAGGGEPFGPLGGGRRRDAGAVEKCHAGDVRHRLATAERS